MFLERAAVEVFKRGFQFGQRVARRGDFHGVADVIARLHRPRRAGALELAQPAGGGVRVPAAALRAGVAVRPEAIDWCFADRLVRAGFDEPAQSVAKDEVSGGIGLNHGEMIGDCRPIRHSPERRREQSASAKHGI